MRVGRRPAACAFNVCVFVRVRYTQIHEDKIPCKLLYENYDYTILEKKKKTAFVLLYDLHDNSIFVSSPFCGDCVRIRIDQPPTMRYRVNYCLTRVFKPNDAVNVTTLCHCAIRTFPDRATRKLHFSIRSNRIELVSCA